MPILTNQKVPSLPLEYRRIQNKDINKCIPPRRGIKFLNFSGNFHLMSTITWYSCWSQVTNAYCLTSPLCQFHCLYYSSHHCGWMRWLWVNQRKLHSSCSFFLHLSSFSSFFCIKSQIFRFVWYHNYHF